MNLLKLPYKKQVLEIINRVYKYKLTTTSGGNISALDDNGNLFITPSGIDKGSLSVDDICEVKPSGEQIGKYAPSCELPFHSGVYKESKIIRGIVHAHAPAVVAYAVARVNPNTHALRAYSDINFIGNAEYLLPGSIKLGNAIRREFKSGTRFVMMDNHGATVGGANLMEAYTGYELLDHCANVNINANILGGVIEPKNYIPYQNVNYEYFTPAPINEKSWSLKSEIIAFLRRSYNQGIVNSFSGTIAVRYKKGFIYNPDNLDRLWIEADELEEYENGKLNVGAQGSKYLPFIAKLFDANKEANAVFIAMPPYAMGFAASNVYLDSKLIPESYMMMKDTVKLPANSIAIDDDSCSKAISPKSPVAIVDNECVITLGKNLTKAFDRMEVTEFSAKSIILADKIGKIVSISDEETLEINDNFNGW